MKDEINMIGLQMLRLCRSVLLERKLKPDYVNRIDTDKLFQLCEYHCLTALVCTALEYNCIPPDKKWSDAKAKAIRKNMLLDAERGRITALFEKEHIWYMPLKGVYMKDYYPAAGTRQMADNDILYDQTRQKDVVKIFRTLGYDTESIGKTHHDVFFREPLYNFEMHTSLVGKTSAMYSYYADIKEKLLPVEGKSYEYRFREEDFYIYMTAHAYKHYSGGGTGLRTLIDYFLYLKSKESSMDWEYIDNELEKLNLNEFEAKIHQTAEKVFSSRSSLTDDENEMVRFMLGSGTYGSFENSVINMSRNMRGDNKAQYILRRLFPNMEWLKMHAPAVAKYPVLYPFYLIRRYCRMIFVSRKQCIRELKIICKMDNRIFQKEN